MGTPDLFEEFLLDAIALDKSSFRPLDLFHPTESNRITWYIMGTRIDTMEFLLEKYRELRKA